VYFHSKLSKKIIDFIKNRLVTLIAFLLAIYRPLSDEWFEYRPHFLNVCWSYSFRLHYLCPISQGDKFKHLLVFLNYLVEKVLIASCAVFQPLNPVFFEIKTKHLLMLCRHVWKVTLHSRNFPHRFILVKKVWHNYLPEMSLLLRILKRVFDLTFVRRHVFELCRTCEVDIWKVH